MLGLSDKITSLIAAGGLGVSLIGCATLAVKLHESRIETATVQQQITDPVNGWAVRWQTAENNVTQLEQTLARQNTAIAADVARSSAALADATKSVAAVQGQAAQAQREAATLLAPAKGDTVCDRVLDVDGRLLESLK